jgi:T-complex protein 1 subunit eta
MEVSRYLREHSRTILGKQQLLINAFAKALEVIPRQISDNAGFDSTDLLNQLRQKHAQGNSRFLREYGFSEFFFSGGTWFGIDIVNEQICDTFQSYVWEPTLIKTNSFTAATEAACLILSVDETVKNAQSEKPQSGPLPRGGGGRGMRGGVRALRGR